MVVGSGSVDPIEATYGETIPEYRGNPLIEALRQEPGRNELRKELGCRLKYDFDSAMAANTRQRKEMVETLKFFFVPLPRHLDLVNGIFSMIRKGYASRNPAWGDQDSRLEASLESAGLFGPSGTGKTQSVRRILKLMPQVIHHSNYNGRTVDETQVTWINVECPPTPRALCASILDKTDKILGTNYEAIYGGTRVQFRI